MMLSYIIASYFLPHVQAQFSSILNRSIQTLLLVISIGIYFKEPNRRNRFIFLNFACFFFVSLLSFGMDFIQVAFLREATYARFFFVQYLQIAYPVCFSFAVVYLVIDLWLNHLKVFQKYAITFGLTLLFSAYYFHPFFQDPLYLYSSEEIRQWKVLAKAVPESGEIPSTAELATKVRLQTWRDGKPTGDLYPEENFKRIETLLPYLEGNNVLILLFKPLYLDVVKMNAMFVIYILLFFGYQYKKDPPQGAYIDKIMFLLLLLASMEIIHNWGYMKSVEMSSWDELFGVGQYVTILIELLMVLFFSLRLKFITSVHGEFYETELAANPQQVSRWRDWVDNIVLAKFFNFKTFNGRLFQNPSSK